MKIEFLAGTPETGTLISAPKPANTYIPEWYKAVPPQRESNMTFDEKGVPNLNIKNCMPFIDALTTGYILETWEDIFIYDENGQIKYTCATLGVEQVVLSNRTQSNIPVGSTFYGTEMIWKSPWRAKTPEGYSVLITHPLSRVDLPFVTLSGVIDSDHFYHTPIGNIPFYIKAGFTGLIPAGTPMYQIIPFKRENWESSTIPYEDDKVKQRHFELRKHLWGAYKNKFRQKKTYR